MIRIATREDEELIYNHAMKFVETTPYKDHISERNIRNMIELFTQSDDKIILLYGDVGMIVGMAAPFIFGGGYIATELAWWVDPEERKNGVGSELLSAFEYWANKIGCKMVSMSSLDDQVGKFYEKNGYVLQERAYVKVL